MVAKRSNETAEADRSGSLDRAGTLDRSAMTRGLGARAPAQDVPSEEAKLRVSQALTQAPKAAPPPLTKKSGKRRATVAQRAKPTVPAPAAAAGTAAAPAKQPPTKVDCRQPFWIDEGGIRRLKMACL